MRRSLFNLANGRAIACGLALTGGEAFCQQSLETNYRITGDAVVGAFEKEREVIQKVSAVIYQGRKEIAYGIVVSSDGYIISKASEVEGVGTIGVRVDKESYDGATVVMVDPRWDVALIKVDAEGLRPAEFAPGSDLGQGTWVVVNGATSRSKRRVLAGIISAKAREIPPEGGPVLGVKIAQTDAGVLVTEVYEKSGAIEAGILVDDLIKAIDGKAVTVTEELGKVLTEKKSGDIIKISVERKGKTEELDVRLSARGEIFGELSRNDVMSGDFSKRRSGFPRVIQHDVLANSNTMGGPVLDLEGKVIGMNIARANRAETFAIPGEELGKLAEGMIRQSLR